MAISLSVIKKKKISIFNLKIVNWIIVIWPTININCPNPNNKTLTLLMARAYLDS